MKKVFRRNQVIITSLVIMIIVAGYLNFTADQSTTAVSENQPILTENDIRDISEEDLIVDVDVNPEEDMADIEMQLNNIESLMESETLLQDGSEASQTGQNITDGESLETGETQQVADSEGIDDVTTIGEAVLTSAAARNFSAAAKLNREQTRSQVTETLMEVINNGEAEAGIRQEAMDNLLQLTEFSEAELAAETLLEAKGFSNSVVSINNQSVDVVICLESLTEAQKAQIEDIVRRKANVEADKIVITTLAQ